MKKVMTDKRKILTHILLTDPEIRQDKNITQKEIADLFEVSQSSVSQAAKEMKFRSQISELQKEVNSLRGEAKRLAEKIEPSF